MEGFSEQLQLATVNKPDLCGGNGDLGRTFREAPCPI